MDNILFIHNTSLYLLTIIWHMFVSFVKWFKSFRYFGLLLGVNSSILILICLSFRLTISAFRLPMATLVLGVWFLPKPYPLVCSSAFSLTSLAITRTQWKQFYHSGKGCLASNCLSISHLM